jgi:hypothetical protein
MDPSPISNGPMPERPTAISGRQLRLAMLGIMLVLIGLAMYVSAIVLSMMRLAFFRPSEAAELIAAPRTEY